MAVPTIYYKLITYFNKLSEKEKKYISGKLLKFRLMVSGSAALPVSVLEEWREISGHTLLERYGMTEIGMAISNPYNGKRKPGHIGQPLHGVSIRLLMKIIKMFLMVLLVKYRLKVLMFLKNIGENLKLLMKHLQLMAGFKSGDIAIFNVDSFKILGRNSG